MVTFARGQDVTVTFPGKLAHLLADRYGLPRGPAPARFLSHADPWPGRPPAGYVQPRGTGLMFFAHLSWIAAG